jgi:hypothetical protein
MLIPFGFQSATSHLTKVAEKKLPFETPQYKRKSILMSSSPIPPAH